jgi:hypothetical protein
MPGPLPFFQVIRAALMPTPGAMAYALENDRMPLRPFVGPGIGARFQFATLFPTPQHYQTQMALAQTGLTGVVHGQSALQPLSNPYAG